jgi:hypothetical protein
MHFLFSFLLAITATRNYSFENSLIKSDSAIRRDSVNVNLITSASLHRYNFDDSLTRLYNQIGLADHDLSFEVFRYGMIGYYAMEQEGMLNNKNLLTIIDFTKSSTQKRFYTIDLKDRKLTFYTYTSHGKNTGDLRASAFSNKIHSNQSSMGFYVTGETYMGSKGFSLKLDGKENGINDKMRERGVVIHEADYVSEAWIKKYGRLGRSFGCPALPKGLSREIINVLKNGTAIFAYFNDETYLHSSPYLNLESVLQKWEQQQTLSPD